MHTQCIKRIKLGCGEFNINYEKEIMKNIKIVDRPCGWGKTSELIDMLTSDKNYIIVVPRKDEAERVKTEAKKRGIDFHRPGFVNDNEVSGLTKSDHIAELISQKVNVVCTHALFYRLGALGTNSVVSGFRYVSPLTDYHLVIDEVPDPFASPNNIRATVFRRDYIDLGMAVLGANGFITPTKRWDQRYGDAGGVFSKELYLKAKSGSLALTDRGVIIQTFPKELLTKPKSVTVLTFLSEGSFFRAYVEKLVRNGEPIKLEVSRLPENELNIWKKEIAQRLQIESIESLEDTSFSFGAQTKNSHGKNIPKL